MIGLRVEFLAGRFHANPWDSGTNEGDVEWPPSPWRLLRAIVAGWFRSGAEDRDVLLRVLDALSEPPCFMLPRATAGHSRHYVPLGGLRKGKPEKTQILDSFLALERDREHAAVAYASWNNAICSSEERALLARACRLIPYLGRAESWCEVSVVDAVPADDALTLVDVASKATYSGPVVRRIAPGESLRGAALLRSLAEETGTMRRARRLVPEGITWVEYRLPSDFLLVRQQFDAREERVAAFGPVILRFAVERPREGVLPPITRAIDLADVMRRAALSRYSRRDGMPASLRLAGKDDCGKSVRREGHDHPYYLPFDSRSDGKIDRIDVWFPKGCTHDEYRAVASIDGLCNRAVFDEAFPLTFLGNVAPADPALVWESITPVVLDRFPKVRGEGRSKLIDGPAEQLQAMIRRRFGAEVEIDLWEQAAHVRRHGGIGARLDAFRSRRPGKSERLPPAVGATLRFAAPITGPIVLGRLAHFGLGQFAPCD